jgi:hypothetical protein
MANKPSRQRKPRYKAPDCPHCCSQYTFALRSKIRSNGTRLRRLECHACQHRWTEADNSLPLRRGGVPSKRGHAITPDEVKLILTSELSNYKLGKQLQIHASTVSKIRVGRIHRRIHPEIPRRDQFKVLQLARSCLQCQHWGRGRCRYDFPDPLEEGPSFAQDCDLFSDSTQPASIAA